VSIVLALAGVSVGNVGFWIFTLGFVFCPFTFRLGLLPLLACCILLNPNPINDEVVMSKPLSQGSSQGANALARQAMERIREIDRKAAAEKHEQVEGLVQARAAIENRLAELHHQQGEIDAAIAQIVGTSHKPSQTRRPRSDHKDLRERLVRWLQAHKGERYSFRQLAGEFPELADVSFAIFIKPVVETGQINKEGNRVNMTYSAA
jgi:hypothetical protein